MAEHNRKPLIAGNWKMNLDHLQAIATVQKLDWSLQDASHNFDSVEVTVCAPFTDLRSVQTLLSSDKSEITLGAQDVSEHDSGAYTGEISALFLSKLDVKYVIVGHSERRSNHSETDETVATKAAQTQKHGMIPIVCVGETEADLNEHGPAKVAIDQLRAALNRIDSRKDFVVAYEPVWAIGTGQAATPEDAEAVCKQLRDAIAEVLEEETSTKTKILYGGSVTSMNVASFMKQPNIDGVLVGGASLKADEFSKIAQFRKHVIA